MKTPAWILLLLFVSCIPIWQNANAAAAAATPSSWGTPTPGWDTVINVTLPNPPATAITLRVNHPLPEQTIKWQLMSIHKYVLNEWNTPLVVAADGQTGEATLTLTGASFPAKITNDTYYLFVRLSPYPWNTNNEVASTVATINITNPNQLTLCPTANPNDPGGPVVIKSELKSAEDENGVIVSTTHPGTLDFRIFSPGPNIKLYPTLHKAIDNELFMGLIKQLTPVELKWLPSDNSKFAKIIVSADDFPADLPEGKYFLTLCVPDPTNYGPTPATTPIDPGKRFSTNWISLKRNYTSPPVQPMNNVTISYPSPAWSANNVSLPEMKILQPMKLMFLVYDPLVSQTTVTIWLSKAGVTPAPKIRNLGTFQLTNALEPGGYTHEFSFPLAKIMPPVPNGEYAFLLRFPYMEPYGADYVSGAFRILYPEFKAAPPKTTHTPTTTDKDNQTHR